MTLNNNNTYTGGTIISAGTLTLDYTGAATSIIPSTSSLTLGGGTLVINGNASSASSQTFASTALQRRRAAWCPIVNNGTAPTPDTGNGGSQRRVGYYL